MTIHHLPWVNAQFTHSRFTLTIPDHETASSWFDVPCIIFLEVLVKLLCSVVMLRFNVKIRWQCIGLSCFQDKLYIYMDLFLLLRMRHSFSHVPTHMFILLETCEGWPHTGCLWEIMCYFVLKMHFRDACKCNLNYIDQSEMQQF